MGQWTHKVQWSSGRVSVLRLGGCRFDPWLGLTKDKMIPIASLLGTHSMAHRSLYADGSNMENQFHILSGCDNQRGFNF